jgi:AmiR/NasT family two-component response regulator
MQPADAGTKTLSRILVVDDEPIIMMDLAQMLEARGYSVVGTANDGLDAMRLARETSPDVILMDVKMPLCDGFTAAQNILRAQPDICIICCTAFADDAFISQAESIGMAGYILKPIEERSLLATIEISLSMSRRLAHNRERIREAIKKLEARKQIDKACGLLSRQKNITHDEAYSQLQKMAMDRRTSLADMAFVIVQCTEREQVSQLKAELMNALQISEEDAWKRISREAKATDASIVSAARKLVYHSKLVK